MGLCLLQEQVFGIPLSDIKSVRTTRAKKQGKAPTVDIIYGSSAKPKTISLQLKQVRTYSCNVVNFSSEYWNLSWNGVLVSQWKKRV